MIRGKRPLSIGSRTFVKINRGAVTGLPEGHIGKMADFPPTCDWVNIKGAVGQHLAMLLSTLLSEKGVHTPELPVIMGGILIHRLPNASDDRAGLTGSLDVISALASQQIT